MAQNKIKTLRKLSLDEVNSIDFISGRNLKVFILFWANLFFLTLNDNINNSIILWDIIRYMSNK